jgi:hypothetical protein
MFFLSLLLRWLFLRALLLLISRSPFQPAQKVKPSSLELRRLSRRRAFWRNPSPSWMRVLVLRQEKSILVVFDRRPQLIGLSVRADVLNSAKKRMDSFPGLFISQTEETEQKRERVDVSRDAMKTRRRSSSSSSSSFRNNTTTQQRERGKFLISRKRKRERSETTTHHIYIYSERERESDRREGILFLRLRAEGVCVCNEFE